jgi:signal transduction histidine kinase
MRKSFVITMILGLLLPGNFLGQQVFTQVQFDSIYETALSHIPTDLNLAISGFELLSSNSSDFSPVQEAKTSFLKLKILYSDKENMAALERKFFAAPDSLGYADSILYSARKYLERSMPDKAISLLMQVLDILPAGSDKADFGMICLSEAYRQKQEHLKAIELLYTLLQDKSSVSEENRAYAYSRMAALYNESGNSEVSINDTVVKYSTLCLELSGKINSIFNLATSQNELSYQYVVNGEYEKALALSQQAVTNFISCNMPFYAMNALINQSNVYIGKKQYNLALGALEEAAALSCIEENRNLYMRLYNQFAKIYDLKGDYKDAYDFLFISHQLQVDFFKDRINMQINELSAKYDLLIKEQKIDEEKKKNEFKQLQIILLLIISIILFIAFILSLFYFRLKKKEASKQKLMEAIVETETNERKRIARDLHDGLGPVLSAINHYFQAYLDAKDKDKENIQKRLQHVITDAIDEVSRISHNISPHVLENHGLITALNNFIAPVSSNGKIKVSFTFDYSERFDLKKELTLYRCITELINNTMKHADATKISLHIFLKDKMLHVDYSDNGKGFDISQGRPDGMGLYNIRNRVESFGGKLVIESSHKKGIKTLIKLPIT